MTFEEALAAVTGGRIPHLLLGNGFSRACRNDIFAYGALFERADFNHLSPLARQAFGVLGTTDFEVVIRALRDGARLIRAYAPDIPDLASRMRSDAERLATYVANSRSRLEPKRSAS